MKSFVPSVALPSPVGSKAADSNRLSRRCAYDGARDGPLALLAHQTSRTHLARTDGVGDVAAPAAARAPTDPARGAQARAARGTSRPQRRRAARAHDALGLGAQRFAHDAVLLAQVRSRVA